MSAAAVPCVKGQAASGSTDVPGMSVPVVSLAGITRRFPGVVACDAVDLDIYPGEVHVLLGENGAGKSTLIGMLCGLLQPDAGIIRIDGKPVRISSPRHAIELGIGTVFQHSMLVPSLSVTDNLLLGASWWKRPARSALARRVGELADSLGMQVKLEVTAADLSLGEQQQVEILRALLRDSRVLILDESTSLLSPTGVEELGGLMRRLVQRGMAVVFISHKLNEAAAFGDRLTMLKLGRVVGRIDPERFRSLPTDSLISQIVESMFGTSAGSWDAGAGVRPVRKGVPGDTVLQVERLRLAPGGNSPGLHDLSFSVRAGEILGLAGIDGSGQTQLAEALAGQNEAEADVMRIQDVDIGPLDIGARRRAGLRYLTDDRLGEGTIAAFSVSTNLFLKQVGDKPLWRAGVANRRLITRRARERVDAFDVRTPSVHTPVGRLSGGNIQKVMLGRELAEGSRVVIFNKPTYGLDVANTTAIRQRIVDIAECGIAVLLLSTELDELLLLSDRIGVLSQGRLVGIVENGLAARQEVGRLMVGVTT